MDGQTETASTTLAYRRAGKISLEWLRVNLTFDWKIS